MADLPRIGVEINLPSKEAYAVIHALRLLASYFESLALREKPEDSDFAKRCKAKAVEYNDLATKLHTRLKCKELVQLKG